VGTVGVINRVKDKIAALQAGLPRGVTIVPFYDRSGLIERAVHTLERALIEEAIVVTLVNIVFLLNVRSVLIVTIPIPLAVLTAFLFMRYLGITSNIMSLAGIAIAIGVLVDAAIVVTENAFRFMEQRGVNPRHRRRVLETVLDASRLVARPIVFAMAIIILAFIPVFALTGQEGKLFHPLAFTKTLAMVGATILSVSLVPVLCSLLIGAKIRGEEANPVMRPLVCAYRPVLGWALRHWGLTLAAAVLVMAGAVALVPRMGQEFMPPLNEGDLMFMPITDPAVSLGQALEITRKQNAAIQAVPEVASVVAKISRADTSTDPAPLNMTETVVTLKPESAWRPGMTRETLIAELDAATTLPGVSNIWTQPIINRINMLTTGIRSEVGVKVFGNDLRVLKERARAVADVLRNIPGAVDVYPGQVTGAPYLDVRVNREAAARYGITVGAVQDVIETAVGEANLTVTIEWSGQYENEVRARQRLQIVVPVVLAVIFMLLYVTYGSFLDAPRCCSRCRSGSPAGSISSTCSATTSPWRCGSASSRCSARPCRPRSHDSGPVWLSLRLHHMTLSFTAPRRFNPAYGGTPMRPPLQLAEPVGPHARAHAAALAGRAFASWDDLNTQCRQWLDTVANVRVHGTTRRRIDEAFAEEQPCLIALPAVGVPAAREETRTIQKDG